MTNVSLSMYTQRIFVVVVNSLLEYMLRYVNVT